MNFKTVELENKNIKCPVCGTILDGAICVTEEGAMPKPGDISVCYSCGTLLQYGKGLFLHELSDEVLNQLRKENPDLYMQLITAQQAVIAMNQNS